MRYIALSRGAVAVVDDEDYALVSGFRWSLHGEGYASRNVQGVKVLMHRFIMGPLLSQQIDHVNGNRLDNRRANLRICTRTQNSRNRRKLQWKRWKGVIARPGMKNVYARIGGRHLGTFPDEHAAARAYDKAALELYGEFARLNFPNDRVA